ncbi:MAG TPA: PilZ domain-containing protein, partial [Gammaproteobacteria bacterium]|nr:PilZ domain-containing protein [Gammaproteobacteria bacterium]
RGKVPYECKPVTYRNRQFWMDDISHEAFKNGIHENNGLFTVGMFEDMLNASHTYRGMQAQKISAVEYAGKQVKPTEQSIARQQQINEDLQIFTTDAPTPEIIPLGYYERRQEARIQHVIKTLVMGDQKSMPLKTRDISSQGIQVCAMHPLPFVEGEQVLVDFPGLVEEYGAELKQVSYRVLRIAQHHEEYRMCLSCGDGQLPARNALDDFVDSVLSSAGRRKLDTQDRQITAASMLTELHYILSSGAVPLFICTDPASAGDVKICTIGGNKNNQEKLDLFSLSNKNHAFSHMSHPQRVKKLHEHALEDGQRDPLMAVYRENNKAAPSVLFDFELADTASWKQFVKDYGSRNHFHVFKVLLRPVSMPESRKILHRIERLTEKSIDDAEDVLEMARGIVSMGVLIDVSKEVLSWADDGIPASSQLADDYVSVIKSLAASTGPEPEIIQFGYVEHRHEDRYIVALETEIGLGKKSFSGTTRDISIQGMSVILEQPMPVGVNCGDVIRIGLPALSKRSKLPDLMNIPYEICKLYKDKNNLMNLKRTGNAGRAYTDFFQDLIKRNSQRIKIDMEDWINAGISRLFASLAAENSATIPILVYKDIEAMNTFIRVALPTEHSTFLQFFETNPDEYDFSPLNVSRRLAELSTRLRKGENAEMVVYMFKRPGTEAHQFEILSVTDSEFQSDESRKLFFEQALQHDHCAVKVRVDKACTPERIEINAMIERLYECSPYQANKLIHEFSQLYAVGDLVDVTQQVMGHDCLQRVTINTL